MKPEQWQKELEKPSPTVKALRLSEAALRSDGHQGQPNRLHISGAEALQLAQDLLRELPEEEWIADPTGFSRPMEEKYVEKEICRIRALRLHPD